MASKERQRDKSTSWAASMQLKMNLGRLDDLFDKFDFKLSAMMCLACVALTSASRRVVLHFASSKLDLNVTFFAKCCPVTLLGSFLEAVLGCISFVMLLPLVVTDDEDVILTDADLVSLTLDLSLTTPSSTSFSIILRVLSFSMPVLTLS